MNLWTRSQRLAARGTDKFKNIFSTWNNNRFSSRECIGYSMKLIKECQPKDPTQWELFYLNSGQEGLDMKNAIPDVYPEQTMKRMLRLINVNHGKSYEELKEISFRFKEALERDNIHISEEEALNFTYIRAIDEAWIGYQRELAAEKALRDYCDQNGLTLRATSERKDVLLGVDWEILKDDTLICGIQVKGSAYKKAVMENTQMKEYDENLKQQNRHYTDIMGVPVFYLFVQKNLQMENMEELQENVKNRLHNAQSIDTTKRMEKK